MRRAWFAMMAVAVVAGCGGEPQADTSAAGDDPVYTLTVVSKGPDGAPLVTRRPISASEQAAAVAARRQLRAGGNQPATSSEGSSTGLQETQSALNPTNCGPNDMWMYDLPNFGGNEICFHGPDVIDLRNYCAIMGYVYGQYGIVLSAYCAGFWSDNLRSFWAGEEDGLLEPLGVRNDCSNIKYFAPWEMQTNYSSYSTFLAIGGYRCL